MNVEVKEEVVVAKLRVENSEFQKWEQEHRKLEDTLMGFESHRYLTVRTYRWVDDADCPSPETGDRRGVKFNVQERRPGSAPEKDNKRVPGNDRC